jgi:hypothetical protein
MKVMERASHGQNTAIGNKIVKTENNKKELREEGGLFRAAQRPLPIIGGTRNTIIGMREFPLAIKKALSFWIDDITWSSELSESSNRVVFRPWTAKHPSSLALAKKDSLRFKEHPLSQVVGGSGANKEFSSRCN